MRCLWTEPAPPPAVVWAPWAAHLVDTTQSMPGMCSRVPALAHHPVRVVEKGRKRRKAGAEGRQREVRHRQIRAGSAGTVTTAQKLCKSVWHTLGVPWRWCQPWERHQARLSQWGCCLAV